MAATIVAVQGEAVVVLEAVEVGVALGIPRVVVALAAVKQRRRIDPSGLEKLHADISLPQLRTVGQLNQLATYPVVKQMAAFRIVLDPAMYLDILSTSALFPVDVLDHISTYIRSKRNIALD